MALTVNQLGVVRAELLEACTKWYDIGLALNVPVTTLDSIEGQFGNHSDKLRETLKVWLKTASEPTWQDVVGVLKSRVVGEPKLASDIEAQHHTTAETGQVSGQTIPEVQQPQLTIRATELQTLQQALQDSRELRIKDQQESQRRIDTLQQELHDSQRQNGELTQQVETKNQLVQSIVKDLLQRDQTIRELRAAIDQLKWQLQQAQQQVEEKQHATDEEGRQVQEIPEQLLAIKRPGPLPQKSVMQQKAVRDMKWPKESKAPEKMYRGSAAEDSNVAYFNGNGPKTVYSYDSTTRKWSQLPDTPHTHFTLVVVQHVLTTVGGLISGGATDSLLSLKGEGRDKKWLPYLPTMPTKRYYTAAVCSGHSLIVAGGRDYRRDRVATVEVLDTDTWQWSTASSLIQPFITEATISICGERLYMLGGLDQTGMTHSVLSCSVPELLQSCQPQQTAPANQSTIWRRVANAPHYLSSCATLCGQLVAVGGRDEADKDTSAIIGYNETTDSWEAMGDMPTARSRALVAILNGKMMVVGGWVLGIATDVVEILC